MPLPRCPSPPSARIIRALSPGYILAPSQDFEGDVPVENILALYDARGLFSEEGR